MKHPLSKAEIAVYARIEGNSGPNFIAKILPVKQHPIFFAGVSAEAARLEARKFCDEAAEKNEAEFARRAELSAKQKARKAEGNKLGAGGTA